jgi:hypothetical protein
MKKLLLIVSLILATFLAACGPPPEQVSGGEPASGK